MLPEKIDVLLIGYSGHAFVVADCLLKAGKNILGYCENEEKIHNPFALTYFGKEGKNINLLQEQSVFIAIGNNQIREKIFQNLKANGVSNFSNAIHPSVIFGQGVEIENGILFAANVTINPLAKIAKGVICNTGCIIEHECEIDEFAHIAPGAVLAGNVNVGKRTFVGANSVVKQGITIGDDVTIGAGSVIIKDIPNGATVVGNPGKIIKIK